MSIARDDDPRRWVLPGAHRSCWPIRQDLLFSPGTGFEYTDAGLFLCQLITEKAGGAPWWRFVTERLFTPAGMTSMVSLDPALIIKNRVSGHELTAGGEMISNRRTSGDFGPVYNDVGANIVDFARWAAVRTRAPRCSSTLHSLRLPIRGPCPCPRDPRN